MGQGKMKQKNRFLGTAFAIIVMMALPFTASALIVNPNPGAFFADSGAEVFSPSNPAVGIELVDPLSGEFGFYRQGDSGTLITIFDSADATGDSALINFDLGGGSGAVIDLETVTPQSIFSAGLGDIGFYLIVNATTIYSEASLNSGGADQFAAFQNMANPLSYLLGFEFIQPTGARATVALEIVNGISEVQISLTEPSTLMLILLAMPMFVFLYRRKAAENIR